MDKEDWKELAREIFKGVEELVVDQQKADRAGIWHLQTAIEEINETLTLIESHLRVLAQPGRDKEQLNDLYKHCVD